MQRDSEDDAWRAIVENYGDRPELDPDPDPDPEPEAGPEPATGEPSAAYAVSLPPREVADEERYIPPPPPPLPRPPRDRLLAWIGVFGAPAVLLTCLVLAVDLPSLLSYALVGSFVGGFLYLVSQMPSGPRDPWDDGAQV